MNKTAILLFSFIGISHFLSAASSVDIDSLVSMISANNGSFTQEQASNAAIIQSMKTENNLPDPEVDFSHVWKQKGAGTKYDFGVSQSFDWPGTYSARKKAVRTTALAMDYKSLQNLCDLRLQIKQTLLEAINSHRKISLYGEALATVDSLIRIVERNVEKREVSVLDANRLRIERIGFATKYNEASVAYNDACNRLVEFNGGKPCEDILKLMERKEFSMSLRPLSEYLEECAVFDPRLSYNSMMSQAYADQAKAVRSSTLPGFSVGYKHVYELGDRFNGFSVAMSLPIVSGKGKRKAKEMEAEAFRLESELGDIEVNSRIVNEHSRAGVLKKQIDEYSAIFDKEDHIRLLNRAFEARQLRIADYLSDLIYFTDAKSDFYDLEYQYALQLASLDRFEWLAEGK